jgi:predicted RNase H-like nuclease
MLYTDGLTTPPEDAITFFECYPYTTLVGAHELEYEVERPRYKRPNRALDSPARRPFRAAECDELLLRMSRLATSTPPLNLASHPVTAALLDEASPVNDIEYKHREDLLDAAICAWTAALWSQHGLDRCQILGADDAPDAWGRRPTIIAPARLEQRR